MLSAQQILQKWQQGTAGATQAYTAGVQAVSESPNAKAASAQGQANYQAGVQAAIASGKVASANMAVSLEQWKQACATTGAARLSTGAQKGQAKYNAWLQSKGLAAMQAAKAAAAAVQGPKDDATGEARWRAARDAMKAARK